MLQCARAGRREGCVVLGGGRAAPAAAVAARHFIQLRQGLGTHITRRHGLGWAGRRAIKSRARDALAPLRGDACCVAQPQRTAPCPQNCCARQEGRWNATTQLGVAHYPMRPLRCCVYGFNATHVDCRHRKCPRQPSSACCCKVPPACSCWQSRASTNPIQVQTTHLLRGWACGRDSQLARWPPATM